MRLFFILLLFCRLSQAQELALGSIAHLVEQKVGAIVIKEIYREIDIHANIEPLPAKRAQLQAFNGLSDGEIMRIYSYGAENTSTIRVPTPYYHLETMAFVRKDSGIIINEFDDLKHYVVAKVRGVKHTNVATQYARKIVDLNSTKQLMEFVARGRADIALTNTIDGVVTLKQLGINNLIPAPTPLARLALYHYLHKKHHTLVPIVDQRIQQLKASGQLKRMIQSAESVVFKQYQ